MDRKPRPASAETLAVSGSRMIELGGSEWRPRDDPCTRPDTQVIVHQGCKSYPNDAPLHFLGGVRKQHPITCEDAA